MGTIETIQSLNGILAYLGIATIFATIFLIVDMYGKRLLAPYVRTWGLYLAFIMTTAGTALALVYSEVFGFIPCGLCWSIRVMLFPQVVLTAVALYVRDKMMPLYGIWLSAIGILIGLYQHYIQMGGNALLPCPASGGDCSKRFFFELGFLTFPLMSVLLFAFLIALYTYIRREERNKLA